MDKITITEALSELNLIKKKIDKKKEMILANLAKVKHVPDPYQKQGGGAQVNLNELQAIKDLHQRLMRIRGAISLANLTNKITINGHELSIHDWLTWKREVAPLKQKFFLDLCQKTKQNMDHWAKNPQVFKDEEGKTHLAEYESNIDYAEVMKETEHLGDCLEKLDGQLSLKNALIVVDI